MEWLNWKQAKEKRGTLLKKVEEFWRSKKKAHFRCVKRIAFGGVMRKKRVSRSFVSSEQQRRALAERGVTVVAISRKIGHWLRGRRT